MKTETNGAVRTLPDLPTIGIVGAGTMGRSLAQDCAAHGLPVILHDLSNEILNDAARDIRKSLRMNRFFGLPAVDVDAVAARIEYTLDTEAFARADFVVENTFESREVKRGVYSWLDRVCRPGTVIAANTSAIPITEIGSWTSRADCVVGIHFMNPVPMKPTVELIRAVHSRDAALDTARDFLSRIGKEGINVLDAPGFVSNRVLMLAVNEAAFLVHEGVATAQDADRVFVECFGHKMGMLETADLIGLDTILDSIMVLHDSFNDSKYRPCPLLKTMVAAGKLGRKTSEGFYKYD